MMGLGLASRMFHMLIALTYTIYLTYPMNLHQHNSNGQNQGAECKINARSTHQHVQ
jgi:hypothetical protein